MWVDFVFTDFTGTVASNFGKMNVVADLSVSDNH